MRTPTREEVDAELARMRPLALDEARRWVAYHTVETRKLHARIDRLERTVLTRNDTIGQLQEDVRTAQHQLAVRDERIARLEHLLTPRRAPLDVEGSCDLQGSEERVGRYERDCRRDGREVA